MATANDDSKPIKLENNENGNIQLQQGGGHGGGSHFAGRGRPGNRFGGNRRPPMQQNNVSYY